MTNGETKTILRELQGEKGQIHQFVKIDGGKRNSLNCIVQWQHLFLQCCDPDDKVVCINADEEFSPFTLKFKGLVQLLRSIFLPQGYPFSVSNDYLEYQLWDTVQVRCTTLRSSLISWINLSLGFRQQFVWIAFHKSRAGRCRCGKQCFDPVSRYPHVANQRWYWNGWTHYFRMEQRVTTSNQSGRLFS